MLVEALEIGIHKKGYVRTSCTRHVRTGHTYSATQQVADSIFAPASPVSYQTLHYLVMTRLDSFYKIKTTGKLDTELRMIG